jgi:hypothetical protein
MYLSLNINFMCSDLGNAQRTSNAEKSSIDYIEFPHLVLVGSYLLFAPKIESLERKTEEN